MNPTDTFEEYRPMLFAIAYRMLGSVMEAEDIVQDAYLRYQAVDPATIDNPKSFLSAIVTRLCLNYLDRASVKREVYIGPWMPEPLPTNNDRWLSPARRMAEFETISMAFMVILQNLTPVERAVFLLREVFDYDYQSIAAIVDKSESTCRQIMRRARQHIDANRPRFDASPESHEMIFGHFIKAIRTGDLTGLMNLLSEDVTLWADGGGKAAGAALRPLNGPEHVAQFVIGAGRRYTDQRVRIEKSEVNARPAFLFYADGTLATVLLLDILDDKIQTVRFFANPNKLQAIIAAQND